MFLKDILLPTPPRCSVREIAQIVAKEQFYDCWLASLPSLTATIAELAISHKIAEHDVHEFVTAIRDYLAEREKERAEQVVAEQTRQRRVEDYILLVRSVVGNIT